MRHHVLRTMAIVLALAFGPASLAAAPETEAPRRKVAPPASKRPAPAPTKRDAKKAPPDKSGAAEKKDSGVDQQTLRMVMRAKANFTYGVELCERKETCSPELLKTSEKEFLVACEKCATEERCEEERDLIRDGKAERKANPCK